jgi:hypothetical protein
LTSLKIIAAELLNEPADLAFLVQWSGRALSLDRCANQHGGERKRQ